ncbi:MAG: prolyl oligopeptidase family serine peptidase [Deltaproteobacteria bacterium]|nr:prolyl oligopeptidase family serine peptidase [Nannocystaceae bacterium]
MARGSAGCTISVTLLALGALAPAAAFAADGTLGLVEGYSVGNNYGYIEYLPPEYDGVTPMPVLVFLSGIGEVGTGLDDGPCSYPTYGPSFNGTAGLCNNVRHGPPMEAWRSLSTGQDNRWPDASRPFIMIAPQNPITQNAYSVQDLEEFFDWLPSEYAIDEQRMYLTGMSQGGRSVLLYLEHDPSRFAGAIMTAGAVSFDQLQDPCTMTQSAFWALHGENDGHGSEAIFQPQSVVDFITGLNGCPGPHPTARMTMFRNAGHNVWSRTFYPPDGMDDLVDAAYDPYDVDIYAWLLQHDKPLVDAGPNFGVAEDVPSFSIPIVAEDADAFTIAWEQTAGPSASLLGEDTDELVVTPSEVGAYSFRVTVVDSDGQWSFDDITVTVGGDGGGGDEGGGEPVPGGPIYAQSFDGLDDTAWPAPWTEGNGNVLLAETVAGRAFLSGVAGNVAIMALPEAIQATDVDYTATISFDAFEQQGVALGARQSNFIAGSALDGYAVFIEGGYQETVSIWLRNNGYSSQLVSQSILGLGLESGVDYQVRFQVFTDAGQTRLRARIWPLGADEPSIWHIDAQDDTPGLHEQSGSFSVEQYNYAGTDGVSVDDIDIRYFDPAGDAGEGEDPGDLGDLFGAEGVYTQTFDGADGASWEVPWIVANANVVDAELVGDRGRLSASSGGVATMELVGPAERDVDAVFSVTYDDFFRQGAGFGMRQNDSPYIDEGYAVFLEGGYQQSFGIWRELSGSSIRVASVPATPPSSGNATYWIRVRSFNEGDEVHVLARHWLDGQAEPLEWDLEFIDGAPELQDAAGSFAFDLYNYSGQGGVSFDDLTITRLGEGGVDPTPGGFEVPEGAIHVDTFTSPDVGSWPFPWYASDAQVISNEIFNGQALLSGETSSVARMILPGYDELDTNTSFTITFDNMTNQGVGFYARHTGTAPGTDGSSGYGVYVEGNTQMIGIWLEDDGIEMPLLETSIAARGYEGGVPYRIRFQVFSEVDGQNRARARIWPVGQPEPGAWDVEVLDDTLAPDAGGTFAFDVFNYIGTGSVRVDDLFVEAL